MVIIHYNYNIIKHTSIILPIRCSVIVDGIKGNLSIIYKWGRNTFGTDHEKWSVPHLPGEKLEKGCKGGNKKKACD